MPRLYRDAPLNGIWKGPGNVQCLDVLRAMRQEAGTVERALHEVRLARGADPRLDAFVGRLERELADATDEEPRARRLVERLALALQGALLVRHARPQSPTPSARLAWAATRGSSSARCRRVRTSTRSSTDHDRSCSR